MSSRHWAFRALIILLAPLCSSCGGATAALVALLLPQGSSGGRASPTVVSDVLPLEGTHGFKESPLSFSFWLRDRNSDPVDVEVLYSIPGGPTLATVLLVGDTNLTQLATSPGGEEHIRQWDFAAQLAGGDALVEDVEITVRLLDGTQSSTSSAFAAGNDAPEVAIVDTPTGELTAVAAVEVDLADSSGDVVDVLVEYEDLAAPGVWNAASTLGQELVGLEAPQGGVTLLFLWDVATDEPGRELQARLRFTPQDVIAVGTPATTGTLGIDNNSEPLLIIDGGAFFANPDERRGIPVPFRVLDDEGDAVQVVVQWRRPSEDFLALPSDPADLIDILSDDDQRRTYQIATELPPSIEGTVVPVGTAGLRLAELGRIGAGILREYIAGRQLEILRLLTPPAGIASSWASSSLSSPAAVVPVDDGDSVYLLDGPAAGSWRLREIDLATGAVLRTLDSGAGGNPNAMAAGLSEGSLFFVADQAGTWKLFEVDTSTGAATLLVTASGATELGTVHGLVLTSANTALVTVGSSLVALDFTNPAATQETAVLQSLEGPWGLALDPRRRGRVYLAEHDWVNPTTAAVEGRVTALELDTLVRTALAGTGTSFPLPSSIALERRGSRLLALTDQNVADGTLELRSLDIAGGSAGDVVAIGSGYADDADGLAAGPDRLRIFCLPSANDLVVSGGLEQTRTIAAYDPATLQADVATDFDPALDPRQRWRIPDSTSSLPAGSSSRRDIFVWDSSDLLTAGEVVLRAFAFDTEPGVATDTGVPRSVSAGIDVIPSVIGGVGSTDAVASIAAGDLNQDGRPDLVSANTAADSLTVFFQTGNGTFPTAPDRTIGGALLAPMDGPVDVAIADVDRDGDLDLVSANSASTNITVALQTGVGTFTPNTLAVGGGTNPTDVLAADLNGDGRVDIAVTDVSANRVKLFYQTALGLFPGAPSLTLGNGSTLRPLRLAAGDLDGDGDIDLVSANENSDNLAIFIQTSPGVFAAAPTTLLSAAAIDAPRGLVVTDLDGDGDLDIASANHAGNNVTVFLQTGGGSFPATPTFTLTGVTGPVQPEHLAAGDINADGEGDLIVITGNDELNIFLYQPDLGTYVSEPLAIRGGDSLDGPVLAVAEDLDGDGLLDIATANTTGNDISVFVQSDSGRFSGTEPDSVLGNALSTPGAAGVAAGDVDGDGDLDIVIANETNGTLSVYPQFGPGVLATSPDATLGGTASTLGAYAVEAADLNADGFVDVVSANRTAGTLTVFFQQVDGSLPPAPDLVLGQGSVVDPVSVQAADLDDDGDLDIACADAVGDTLAIFRQTAPGAFASAPSQEVGSAATTNGPRMVVAADINADGRTDLACANSAGNTLAVFFQDGSGTFPSAPSDTLGGAGDTDSPQAVAVLDLDGDSDLDIMSADATGNDLAIFLAPSPGVFAATSSAQLTDAAMTTPSSLAGVDLDRDGACDLISGNPGSDNLMIYLQGRAAEFLQGRAVGGTGFTDSPMSLLAIDLDGDGDPDVVSGQPDLDNTAVYFGGR